MAECSTEISRWLRDIDDGYLASWANKGLLRRGSKLLNSADSGECEFVEGHCRASLEKHIQSLTGPGFEHLDCSCPAVGACHHLIAFLLCLQKTVDLSTDDVSDMQDAETAIASWLQPDLQPIEKTLGKAIMARAQRQLLQGIEVSTELKNGSLIAQVTDTAVNTVRIPQGAGLDGSVCSCGATRCTHRALTVLSARMDAGLYDLNSEVDDALMPDQLDTISQLQDWVRGLIAQGTVSVSPVYIAQGEALSTVAKQADFPLLASALNGVVGLMRDELAGASFVSAGEFRARLAPLWARLIALQSKPLPQPLLKLAGEHKRNYRLVQNFELIGVAAEAWAGASDYHGLTLHLYEAKTDSWYRHTVARPVDMGGESWSPHQCWKNGIWASGVQISQVPGAVLSVVKGWRSGDGQLSGRDATRIVNAPTGDIDLPIDCDYLHVTQRYAKLIAADPMAAYPSMPVIVNVHKSQAPLLDGMSQHWSQIVEDSNGNELTLDLLTTNAYLSNARASLESLWKTKSQLEQVFGMMQWLDGRMLLRPVSVRSNGENVWHHLTLT